MRIFGFSTGCFSFCRHRYSATTRIVSPTGTVTAGQSGDNPKSPVVALAGLDIPEEMSGSVLI
jgi:hypothetical protein